MNETIQKLSPARPIHDAIPAAPTPSLFGFQQWSYKSHIGLGQGVVVKRISGADGSSPTSIWIGFNKQPPALFNILDSFEYLPGFLTVEFYNSTNTVWTIDAFVYVGELKP